MLDFYIFIKIFRMFIELCVWFIELCVGLLKIVIMAVIVLFTYPIIPDSLASCALVRYGLCYKTLGIDPVYSIICGILAGALTALIIAKFKYIRLVPLVGFGIFWGCVCYGFIDTEILNMISHPRLEIVLCALCGAAIFIFHVYAGVTYCELLGETWDPIGSLIYLTSAGGAKADDTGYADTAAAELDGETDETGEAAEIVTETAADEAAAAETGSVKASAEVNGTELANGLKQLQKLETAQKMIKAGKMPLEEIAEYLDYTLEEVKAIERSLSDG